MFSCCRCASARADRREIGIERNDKNEPGTEKNGNEKSAFLSEKTQQRVDELEKELNSTQRQLSDASARLARLFK